MSGRGCVLLTRGSHPVIARGTVRLQVVAATERFVIISSMTKLLEEAVAQLQTLPEDEQDRAAEVLLAFAQDRRDYTLDAEQIDGIRHAMAQADKGQFASDNRLRKIFGHAL
jgi:hypothetical protein